MEFDVLITGGSVIDGTGAPARRADVAISNGRVAAVGDLAGATAATRVDATGRVVTPGFIDVHAHTDVCGFMGDEHVAVKSAGIRQGVTTEVCGNCGFSPFPAVPDASGENDPYLGISGKGVARYFDSLATYRKVMDDVALFANLAPLVGHGRVRSTVMGDDDRAPTAGELREMQRLVAASMEEGAFGLSSGLVYAPGLYATTEEVIALAEVAGRFGRPYTTHMRNETTDVEDAVAEAIRIGREGRTAVQISHHKVGGRQNWGRSASTLRMIDDARRDGLDVTIDVYPYTAGSTFLAALLPPWVLDGGADAMLERLSDATVRDRIERDYETGLPGWQNYVAQSGWESVVMAGDPPLAGRSIADIADAEGRAPVDVVAGLVGADPGTLIILHMMEEGEVWSISDQLFAIIGSDGVPAPGNQHPRLAGAFARNLRRHRDDAHALADVVRRMTSLAAERFNLGDRGTVAVGKVADLVVLDPSTVTDRATYDSPLLPPEGIDAVLVAGEVVVHAGDLTGARPGRVLAPTT